MNAAQPISDDRKSGTGTVKWFNKPQGWGFIVDETGTDIFVHYRAIKGDGYRYLKDGESVSYIAVRGDKGWSAEEVEQLGLVETTAAD